VPFAEIKCPCCDQFIPPTQHNLAYPTIHCWNCGHTFAAPDSWRDWKPEPGFIARMEEEAAQLNAQRLFGPPPFRRPPNGGGATSKPGREIQREHGRITTILLKQISPLDGAMLFAILFGLATIVSVFIWDAVRR
jgi:hypothetical protein